MNRFFLNGNSSFSEQKIYTANEGNDNCEIIIELKDASEAQIEIIKKYGVIKNYFPMINSYVVELPKKHIEKLEMLENVAAVFENTRIAAQMNNGRRAVCADLAHKRGFDGRSVTVAFLDTGIAPISDFTCPSNRILAFKDFINGKVAAYDDNGHGTHVKYLYSLHSTRDAVSGSREALA